MNEREIFLAALERESAAQRDAFVGEACGQDAELRCRVQQLLNSHRDAGSFLEHPAIGWAEPEHSSDRTPAGLGPTRPDDPTLGAVPFADDGSLPALEPCDKPGCLGRIGLYEITEVVGRGGMGIVLRGHDIRLNRVVAIKVLSPQLASNPNAHRRFLREAQAAAAVSHPHVVTIHAVSELNGAPYLVMEYVAGQSLQQKIDKQGALELREILRIGSQVAYGLSAAHAQGLIHRDVKPANILLENGVQRVKITDFGLARAADDGSCTQTGQIAGTPQYMSPEQAAGETIDHRSDLFSLGSVLYTMCTGRPAFRADSALAVLRRVCDSTPRPIRESNPDIPAWLADVIDRLLAKSPADRIQSATEVAELLERCLAHLQQPSGVPAPFAVPNPAVPRPTAKRFRWAVAAALLIVVGLALGLGLSEATGVTRVIPTIGRLAVGEGILSVSVDDAAVRLRIDDREERFRGTGIYEFRVRAGRHLIQGIKDGKTVHQETVNIARGRKTPVMIALRRAAMQQVSQRIAPLTAKAERLAADGYGSSWSPDGRQVLYTRNDESAIELVELERKQTQILLRAQDLSPDAGLADATFSPDSKYVAFVKRPKRPRYDGTLQDEVWVMAADGGSPRRLADGGYPSWGLDSNLLYFQHVRRQMLQSIRLDVPGGQTRELMHCPSLYPVVSPDGQHVAYGEKNRLRVAELASRRTVAEWLCPQPLNGMLVAWSPDSHELSIGGYANVFVGLWIYDLQKQQAVRVTEAPVGHGRWSRDGRRFAFDVQTGRASIWMLPLEPGRSTAESLLASIAAGASPP
jgi:hypothetical protein